MEKSFEFVLFCVNGNLKLGHLLENEIAILEMFA